jgi:hypothetical protein
MAKVGSGKDIKGKYASTQAVRDGMSTAPIGGDAPDEQDVIESANKRGSKRHEMKGDMVPDVNVLPTVEGPVLDKAGIKDEGYITKKGLTDGVNVFYNSLPPGMDIEDQETADIRKMSMKTVTALGYPGDGWSTD